VLYGGEQSASSFGCLYHQGKCTWYTLDRILDRPHRYFLDCGKDKNLQGGNENTIIQTDSAVRAHYFATFVTKQHFHGRNIDTLVPLLSITPPTA